MDQRSAYDTALSVDRPSISGDAHSDNMGRTDGKTLKDRIFNLLPPATVAAILLFWAYGPAVLTNNPWTPVAVGLLTIFFILGLEQVHERHAGWRMNKREFITDLYYVILANTVISWTSLVLVEYPLTAVKQSLGISTHWAAQLPFLVQVAMVMVLFEFGQYWMHRLMHNNAFFWSTHAPHHHITQLNAMKGFVGNPLELFLISIGAIALFDFTPAAIFGAVNALNAISVFNHANVRADPPFWYSFFFTTIRNHSLHHTALSYEDTRCNYGNNLILLDRIFGTYKEGESSVVGQDDRRRLSIWEQTTFPVRPWIEKFKEKQDNSASLAS